MTDTFANSDDYDPNNNNSGIIPDLFPPLDFNSIPMEHHDPPHSGSSSSNDDYLWRDSSLATMAGSPMQRASSGVDGGSTSSSKGSNHNNCSQAPPPAAADTPMDNNTSVFHISWGGDDKPPADLHLEDDDTEIVSRKPLPKPRGVRRLPEPEPAEDGTLDEDTLRRRRNTHAARRSRLKKFLKIEFLENKVNQLQTENAKLVLSNALLESEKRGWLAKEAEYKKRIKCLEESKGLSPES